jgi:hypothetical protein
MGDSILLEIPTPNLRFPTHAKEQESGIRRNQAGGCWRLALEFVSILT